MDLISAPGYPHPHAPADYFRDSGEDSAEEVRFEAGFKRCERWRVPGLYRDRIPQKRCLILEDLAPALFKLTRGTQSRLSEDDRRDMWGLYEETQCEM